MTNKPSRRQALKIITVTIGGVATVIMLPDRWIRPVVESIIVPAHAQASPTATESTDVTD